MPLQHRILLRAEKDKNGTYYNIFITQNMARNVRARILL